jgi:hypothetical protein
MIDRIKIKNPEVWDVMTAEDMTAGNDESDKFKQRLSQKKKNERYMNIDVNVKVIVHAPLFFKSI